MQQSPWETRSLR